MSSSNPPDDRRYLETHEWHRLSGNIVTIGITHFAADELTDITYVGLPKVGAALQAGSRFGDIESVKASSDLYTGISGKVAEVNSELVKSPGLVNTDPYEAGWMVKMEASQPDEITKLLSADDYLKKVGH